MIDLSRAPGDVVGRVNTNRNGLIEVTELAAYIDQQVPELSFRAFQHAAGAALVRETYANMIITGEDIRNGFVDFLDEPHIDFEEGATPEQAAAEICRRLVNQLRS